MSEIVCAQLHNELGRRHNTLQSHGLFALAKHLFYFVLLASDKNVRFVPIQFLP